MPRFPFFTCLLAVSLLAAPVTRLFAAEPPPFRLTGLKLYPDTPEAQAGTPFDRFEFKDTQTQQYATLIFDPSAAGQKVSVELIATKTTLGVEKPVKSFDDAVIPADARLPISVKLPTAWPVGWYRFEVRQDGRPIGRAGYRVVPAEMRSTPILVQKFHLFREKETGGLEEVKKAKVTDRHLYFSADTKGARTAGAKVSWVLLYQDGPDSSKPPKAAGVDIKDWPLDDTTVSFDVALEKDWPDGRYLLQLRIDDQAIANFGFLIGDKPHDVGAVEEPTPPAKK